MRSMSYWVFITAIVLSGCQVKPEQQAVTKLSAEEANALFTGKTVESFNLVSGSTSFTYYFPDGRVEQERFWKKRTGQWKINEQGEMCLAMEGKPFSCRSIFREGDRYYKYRLSQDGENEKIIRYRQFMVGKAI